MGSFVGLFLTGVTGFPCLIWGYMGVILLGVSKENGKENGSCCLGPTLELECWELLEHYILEPSKSVPGSGCL